MGLCVKAPESPSGKSQTKRFADLIYQLQILQSVCNTAAVQLELKSKQVEKATNELIDMMMSYPVSFRG